ncbi:MAG: biotin--[acetyl-CoA-carboxylase] ligase family protein [Treponema sp.]|jgi:BirA family biotin operon repressor/biotin-[acetyl-CoA-carboxylase] ligase|nr:biotin--[acetyl-CoA-carboxylase] ligase family protein [Treponema sp.]
MRTLSLLNPFGAPVYWVKTTSSTMDDSRRLAAEGAAHGTVIAADFQEAGRGRGRDRPWTGRPGENLSATIVLRYPGAGAIPPALSLKTGLAVALAIEDFAPALTGLVRIKWPNDIMIFSSPPGAAAGTEAAGKTLAAFKAAGILTETDGKTVHIGFGVNAAQTEFPEELRYKAISIALALSTAASVPAASSPPEADFAPALSPESRFTLLEKILARLHQELEGPDAGDWAARLEQRLYLRGQPVRFIAGAAGSGRVVEGRLAGIGKAGELLLLPPGADTPLAFFAGELDVYGKGG